jgi:hypothetical protein
VEPQGRCLSRATEAPWARETAIELQIAPIRSSVNIPAATLWAHFQGGDVEKGVAELEKQANVMIDDLLWWTAALKTARER